VNDCVICMIVFEGWLWRRKRGERFFNGLACMPVCLTNTIAVVYLAVIIVICYVKAAVASAA